MGCELSIATHALARCQVHRIPEQMDTGMNSCNLHYWNVALSECCNLHYRNVDWPDVRGHLSADSPSPQEGTVLI